MQRFFAEPYEIDEDAHRICIHGSDVNHMKNVLRMKTGDDIWVSGGGDREYHCTIGDYREDEAVLHILYVQEPDYELPNKIWLFQGLPKGDKMELIVQKAVELGAFAVVPVEMKRCVVKLDAKKAEKKTARWQQIAESAAKQSKRMLVPEVYSPVSYREALTLAGKLDVCLLPYELEKGMGETKKMLGEIQPGQSIGVFIGPEGGFEEAEVSRAVECCKAKPITLGRRILRTETAGLAVLSVLMFALEKE